MPELPIVAAEDEILRLLADHQVLVVAGATGSGKTTQLPKLCLAAGRKRVVHTQPRRIAARSVAERLAAELDTELGKTVGFQVRFSKASSARTQVLVVTDGVLLAEISHDPMLSRYDTVIVDEAHERSLNIDFLLGFLKQLLPKRPELRVIVTSATIDTERFSQHFDQAPIIEIPGRSYPVEVRYRPIPDGRDPFSALGDAVLELWTAMDGDILVFLSGEREIREAAEVVAGLQLPQTEVVPLYARLSLAEQRRVFASHEGTRIVLATNVAETSITVPGVRAVIDLGLARISRYSPRSKVQRLPIEPVSQASADQRAGRCGRLGPGICLRLFSEADFEARPPYSEPEILRTNLAAIILQMAWARLGDIESFPFVEAPNRANVRDGIRLLRELGALRTDGGLTKTGRLMARMPIDPVLARMLIEGDRRGCLKEVQAIVAGLAIMDVRERPTGLEVEADAAHRRFWAPLDDTPGDDVTALLQLWRYLRDQRRALSGTAFRRLCRDEFLNFLRAREWQDLNTQLKEIGRDLGFTRNRTPGQLADIRMAVLSGLLSHVGAKDVRTTARHQRREYLGARGIRFAISPGSVLSPTPPDLVVALELVETTRLWARNCAIVTADQVEEVGGDLLKRSYYDPHWSRTGGQAVAREKVMLLGVPIVADRLVSLGRIDPALARELFIRSALVEGQWHTRHNFWARNQRAIAKVKELADRARQDVLVSDAELFTFFDERIPKEIVSVAHFDRWWRVERQKQGRLLDLRPDDLMVDVPVSSDDYPDVWTVGGHDLPVTYAFSPGTDTDGVSVEVPLTILNQVSPSALTWQVPGLRLELATEFIKALPKALRVRLAPAPQTATEVLRWIADADIHPEAVPFWVALGRAISTIRGIDIPDSAWDITKVPGHLRLTVASGGKRGTDVAQLARELQGKVAQTMRVQYSDYGRPAAKSWAFGDIPTQTPTDPVAFPALHDTRLAVDVRVFPTRVAADRSQARGLRRLLALALPDSTMWVVSKLPNSAKLALAANPYPSVPDLLADARLAAIDRVSAQVGAVPAKIRTATSFANLTDRVAARIADDHLKMVELAAQILATAAEARLAIDRIAKLGVSKDLTAQLDNLVFAGFLSAIPPSRLYHLPRYLRAIGRRVDGIENNPVRDETLADQVGALEDAYDEQCSAYPVGELPAELEETGWLLEELRVSMFAQQLGTSERVSVKRLRARLGL